MSVTRAQTTYPKVFIFRKGTACGVLTVLLVCVAMTIPGAGGAQPAFSKTCHGQIKVPAGCRVVEQSGQEPYSQTGYAKEIMHERTGIRMVFIPSGEFQMGVGDRKPGSFPETTPLHPVAIQKAFYLGVCEVTMAQFTQFAIESGHETQPERTGRAFTFHENEWRRTDGASWRHPGFDQEDTEPVTCLSWSDAQAYCDWAGLRLPSEAEWEHACRAGSQAEYAFGDERADLAQYGWFDAVSGHRTHPVGTLQPNPWGLYDMHGNVWEWCQDLWHEGYRNAPTDGRAWMDSGEEDLRVVRGGSWFEEDVGCRSFERYRITHEITYADAGFRVAMSLAQ